MIIRKGTARSKARDESNFGPMTTESFSDTAGITQYGAYLQTLQPGAKSSTRHWHEMEDEFLFVVSGQATIVENDGAHVLEPGDVACWPAGVPNAHHVLNQSSEPCSYLIVGTRLTHDICHYPDVGTPLVKSSRTDPQLAAQLRHREPRLDALERTHDMAVAELRFLHVELPLSRKFYFSTLRIYGTITL